MIRRLLALFGATSALLGCKERVSVDDKDVLESYIAEQKYENFHSIGVEGNQIVFQASLPEVSEGLFTFRYEALGIETMPVFTPSGEGKFSASLVGETSTKELEVDLSNLRYLDRIWNDTIVSALQALLVVRVEYGRNAPVLPEAANFTFLPPGDYGDYETEDWIFGLSLTPNDGSYSVYINPDGVIYDAGVAF